MCFDSKQTVVRAESPLVSGAVVARQGSGGTRQAMFRHRQEAYKRRSVRQARGLRTLTARVQGGLTTSFLKRFDECLARCLTSSAFDGTRITGDSSVFRCAPMYFAFMASKNGQRASAIQNNSITLWLADLTIMACICAWFSLLEGCCGFRCSPGDTGCRSSHSR